MSSADTEKNVAEKFEDQPSSVPATSPAVQDAEEVAHVHPEIVHPQINEACRREVNVEIPADVVAQQTNSTVEKYAKVARVPGFRTGKVPLSMIRKRFAEDIRREVVEQLVPQYLREAVFNARLHPVSEPSVDNLEMETGGPMRFTAAFEVVPKIELGNYRDIIVEKPEVKVTDEDVENELKQIQERQASFDPVEEDRPLEDGDWAQISFQATSKNAPEKPAEAAAAEQAEPADGEQPAASGQPVQMDEVLVEIGAANTLPEFTEHLRGAKAGEERRFEVSYPADHFDSRLAGQVFEYTAKVNSIKKKSMPELNDDFAKELSQEFQTLDDLRKRMREGIESERIHQAQHEAKHKLLSELTDKHDFPVPESLVQRQINFRLEQWLHSLANQGMKTEDMKRMDFTRIRHSQHDIAAKEVKSNLLLERIAVAEKIQASDEEVTAEIYALAQQTKQTPEAVRQRLTENNGIERIRARLRTDKALDFLYQQSGTHGETGTSQE